MRSPYHRRTARRLERLDGGTERPSPDKAREILRHGSVRGQALTAPQRRFLGAQAGRS